MTTRFVLRWHGGHRKIRSMLGASSLRLRPLSVLMPYPPALSGVRALREASPALAFAVRRSGCRSRIRRSGLSRWGDPPPDGVDQVIDKSGRNLDSGGWRVVEEVGEYEVMAGADDHRGGGLGIDDGGDAAVLLLRAEVIGQNPAQGSAVAVLFGEISESGKDPGLSQ